MKFELSDKATEDIAYWRKSGQKKVLKKIRKLKNAILDNPYEGIGKPEQLKYELSGVWSRRITQEDRFVYEVVEDKELIIIYSLRGHY